MAPNLDTEEIYKFINKFPGVGRRFERITDGVYSDYAHHPEEIAATIELAKEEADLTGKKGVIAIYEPHQNIRQHEIFDDYKEAFIDENKVFWLPTYLTRENPNLAVLRPEDFIESLVNKDIAEPAEIGKDLEKILKKYQKEGFLVLLMTAGPADNWLRGLFAARNS
jgi:UDP-N-acetylmuramate--alanine ligase